MGLKAVRDAAFVETTSSFGLVWAKGALQRRLDLWWSGLSSEGPDFSLGITGHPRIGAGKSKVEVLL